MNKQARKFEKIEIGCLYVDFLEKKHTRIKKDQKSLGEKRKKIKKNKGKRKKFMRERES